MTPCVVSLWSFSKPKVIHHKGKRSELVGNFDRQYFCKQMKNVFRMNKLIVHMKGLTTTHLTYVVICEELVSETIQIQRKNTALSRANVSRMVSRLKICGKSILPQNESATKLYCKIPPCIGLDLIVGYPKSGYQQ